MGSLTTLWQRDKKKKKIMIYLKERSGLRETENNLTT